MLPTIPVQPHRLDDYAADAGEAAVERLREAARPLKGARLLHLNSTAFGGGVAELLYTQVPLMHDLGIEATWAVLEGSDEFFAVTKDVHNGLQGADISWTPEKESIYWERMRANAAELDAEFDVVFIHDPQPAGLIHVLEEAGARAGAWAWRCHIDMSAPNAAVWAFFEPLVNRYDAAVFTMEEFAQPGIGGPRVAFIPPSIDPTSSKNHELHEETHPRDPRHVRHRHRAAHRRRRSHGSIRGRIRSASSTPSALRGSASPGCSSSWPARWRTTTRRASSTSICTEEHRDSDPDIHLFTNLQNVGAIEINAFQRASAVVIQKSTREGFGLVVSEGMWKGRPVIGGNVGGIRLQIEDGVNGFLVGSVDECAERMVRLLEDEELRSRMGRAAHERVRERFLSTRELEDYCRLLSEVR